jgi:hypothetical protein
MCGVADKPGTCGSGGGGQNCKADKDCDDGNSCTDNECNQGSCVTTKMKTGSLCSDGDGCTSGETCTAGAAGMSCGGGKPTVCDDNDKCTLDACIKGKCNHTKVPNCSNDAGGNVGSKCTVGGSGCGKGLYCKAGKVGQCSGAGTCATMPEMCIMIYKPVCGCDGKNHGNSCTAASAGQNIKSEGQCGGGAGKCLTSKDCDDNDKCTLDACIQGACKHTKVPNCANSAGGNVGAKCTLGGKGCKDGLYCKAAKIGICSGSGTCATKPKMCNKMLAQVCGCDGKTYSNPCMAASSGHNAKSKGACGAGGGGGACKVAKDCNDKDPCTKDTCTAGKCANTKLANCSGGSKSCKTKAQCDDKDKCTNDACLQSKCYYKKIANCAGGGGGAGGGKCTVKAGGCDKGFFCKATQAGDCSGAGTCTKMPALCNAQSKPVCGCDGNDYNNACAAASKGQNSKSSGKCAGGGGGGGAGACKNAADCDDKDKCTNDYCMGNQCMNLKIPNCSNGGGGGGAAGCKTPVDCDDKDKCTTDMCNPITGKCSNTKIPGCSNGGGATPAACGDGKCEGNEKLTCPSDCGAPKGSCKGKCGKFTTGATCQCDTQCKTYKDCCPDYSQVCP